MNSILIKGQTFFKKVSKFACSRRVIPTVKGTIAYLLALILIFSKKFDNLSAYPLAYSAMMIVIIAGLPGKSVGACVQAIGLALLGVLLGCIGFVILANLKPWPAAQAVIFATIVYLMSLVKSRGLKFMGLSLLCILNSFNGVFIGYSQGVGFSSKFFVAYFSAYLWGAAIVLLVNLLVFPKSSERELRETLVTSLVHVGTFAHLLAKRYALEASEEELALGDHMAKTIRADFGFLTQKIGETTVEVNYSKFSLKDYQSFVSTTRGLQQALITAHSSLAGVDRQDVDFFKKRFLPETLVAFNKLRRAVDLTIRELGTELGCRPIIIPETQANYKQFMESGQVMAKKNDSDSFDSESMSERLREISGRLAAEAADSDSTISSTHSGPPDLARLETTIQGPESNTQTLPSCSTSNVDNGSLIHGCGMERLRREFDLFSTKQHNSLQTALMDGYLFDTMDATLRVDNPLTVRDIYGTDGIDIFSNELDSDKLRHRKKFDEKESSLGERRSVDESRLTEEEDSQKLLMEGASLIRVWGFLFALEQFVDQLELLWINVRPSGIKRQRRLHIHLFEALQRPHRGFLAEDKGVDMPLQEALALLEQRPYTPVKLNIWQRLDLLQQLIQSPTSIFAAKTAAAASVFGTLIYASVPRPWFISFALNSGILTIVVALAPTLGQSLVSFVFQIAGSAIGYLWGLAVLEMFRNVGGYTFNPYGIACMIVPYALIMEFLLHERPALFVLGLLALNGTGVLIATEWIAVEYLHRTGFDSPALRTGKAITALAMALAIVAIFQLFILRNPARRTLRKAVASLTYDTLSYMVLVHGLGRAILASRPDSRPSKAALVRVEKELRHRELKLQSAIIQVTPLINFAAAEPQFSKPFKKEAMRRIIQGNQIILDRLREARAALGTQEFQEFILVHFASALAPYRARSTRLLKGELYLIASSLQSKAPLPQFTPAKILTKTARANFIHDCLVLCAQFSKTEPGRACIRSQEFLRYMSHTLCSSAIIGTLFDMEEASKELFGELEEKLL